MSGVFLFNRQKLKVIFKTSYILNIKGNFSIIWKLT